MQETLVVGEERGKRLRGMGLLLLARRAVGEESRWRGERSDCQKWVSKGSSSVRKDHSSSGPGPLDTSCRAAFLNRQNGDLFGHKALTATAENRGGPGLGPREPVSPGERHGHESSFGGLLAPASGTVLPCAFVPTVFPVPKPFSSSHLGAVSRVVRAREGWRKPPGGFATARPPSDCPHLLERVELPAVVARCLVRHRATRHGAQEPAQARVSLSRHFSFAVGSVLPSDRHLPVQHFKVPIPSRGHPFLSCT